MKINLRKPSSHQNYPHPLYKEFIEDFSPLAKCKSWKTSWKIFMEFSGFCGAYSKWNGTNWVRDTWIFSTDSDDKSIWLFGAYFFPTCVLLNSANMQTCLYKYVNWKTDWNFDFHAPFDMTYYLLRRWLHVVCFERVSVMGVHYLV